MANRAQKFWIIKGRNHQGEGLEGKAARIHIIEEATGLLYCDAIPRNKNVATLVYKREILRNVYKPLCKTCRAQALPRKRERKA